MVTPNILQVIETLKQEQQIDVDDLIVKMDPEGNKNISDASYASSLLTIVNKSGSLGQVFAQLNPLYASASKQQKKFLTASDEPFIIKRGKINSLVATLETILDDFAIFGFMQKEKIEDSFSEWYDKNSDYKDLVDIIIWRLYEKHGSFEQIFRHIVEYNNTLTSEYKCKRKNKVILELLKKIDKEYIDIDKYIIENRRLFIYHYLLMVNYPDRFLSPKLPENTKSQVFKIVAAIIHPLKKTKSEGNDFEKQVSNFAADYVFKASILLGRLDENEIELCKKLFDTPEWKEAFDKVCLEIRIKRMQRIYSSGPDLDLNEDIISEFQRKCLEINSKERSKIKHSESDIDNAAISEFQRKKDELYEYILNTLFSNEGQDIKHMLNYFFGINGCPKLKLSNVKLLLDRMYQQTLSKDILEDLIQRISDACIKSLHTLKKNIPDNNSKKECESILVIIERMIEQLVEYFSVNNKLGDDDLHFNAAISVFSEWKLKNKISGDAINVDGVKEAFFIENADAIRLKIGESYRADTDFDISQDAVVNAFKCCFIETLIKEGYRFNPGEGLFEKIKTKDFRPVSASQES